MRLSRRALLFGLTSTLVATPVLAQGHTTDPVPTPRPSVTPTHVTEQGRKMAENFRFFDLSNYTEAQFAEVLDHIVRPMGIFADLGGGMLAASAGGGMVINIADGEGIVKGFWYQNTSAIGVTIGANASGSTRIDTIVVKLDRAANTLQITTHVGTPGAGAPTLTQVAGGTWEFPICDVSVANGAVTLTSGNITDRRTYSVWPAIDLDTAALSTRINNEGIDAYGLFIAATAVLQASNGIASVSRTAAGNYLVTLSVAMASVNYIVLPNVDGGGGNMFAQFNIVSTTQFRIFTRASTTGALADPDYVSFVALR